MPVDSDTCTLLVDQETSTIMLKGITESPLAISYDKDIELTELIITLSKRIDEGKQIELEVPTSEDEKVALVIGTVGEIIDEYNACIMPQEVVEGLEGVDDTLVSIEDEKSPS